MKSKGPRGNVRWAFDEARRLVECDLCEAAPGKSCKDKDDDPLSTVHLVRLESYHKHVGAKDYDLRHTMEVQK